MNQVEENEPRKKNAAQRIQRNMRGRSSSMRLGILPGMEASDRGGKCIPGDESAGICRKP